MRNIITLGVVALAVCPALLPAQTVTVNKGGTGQFNTIGAALSHFTPDPDAGTPNVIQVTDSSLYEEVFSINTPVVLEGTGAEKPILAVQSNMTGTAENGGIVINLPSSLTTGTVVLRNLDIIPALNTNSLRLKTAIENGNNNLFLWLDKVMIAPNAGNNTVLETSGGLNGRVWNTFPTIGGNTNPDFDPAIVEFGGHGLELGHTDTGYTEGDGVELLVQDSVITHFRDDLYEPAPKPACYGIHMVSSYVFNQLPPYPTEFRLTRITGSSVISYCQINMHVVGDLQMDGDPENRIHLRAGSNEGLHLTGPAPNFRNVNNTIIEGCGIGVWDEGFGSVRMAMKHSIIYYITSHVIMVRKQTNDVADGLMSFENCTIVGGRNTNSGNHTIRLEPGTLLDVDFKDCIVGGKQNLPTAAANVISLAGNNICTMSGCGVTTGGQFALRVTNPFSRGVNAVVPDESTYITEDPDFIGWDTIQSDPARDGWLPVSPDFLNVQNPAFATANSEGGPLGGGAKFVGPPAAVHDWISY